MTASSMGQKRVIVLAGIVYVGLLAAIVATAAVAFRDLYEGGPPATGTEMSGTYRQFLGIAGGSLAGYLAIWSAMAGVLKPSYLMGLGALAAGAGITVLALALLPWIYFPFDRYAAPAVWMMANAIPMMVSWLLVTVMGRRFTAAGQGTPVSG